MTDLSAEASVDDAESGRLPLPAETATPFPQRWGQLRKGRTVFRREDRADCSRAAGTKGGISCRKEAAAEVRPARR